MKPWLDDGDVKLYLGGAIDVLRYLSEQSIQTCVTSPPYWGLRDYGIEGQIGLEATLVAYVAKLVEVFQEVRRVLRDDGTVWLNLGDSYTAGGRRTRDPGKSILHPAFNEWGDDKRPGTSAGLKPKDLCGVPWRVAFALQADGWWLRSDIIWSKPNPMPESVKDRPTRAHEYLFLLTKSARYFYDADAMREPTLSLDDSHPSYRRSVWTVTTEPSPEAHFATFPQALVEPCIKAGISEHGCCSECGAPWQRKVERKPMKVRPGPGRAGRQAAAATAASSRTAVTGTMLEPPSSQTIGWAKSCDCDKETEPCTVLDPFVGSGTTSYVARKLGCRSIGIDLNEEYLEIAAKRLQQLSLLGAA